MRTTFVVMMARVGITAVPKFSDPWGHFKTMVLDDQS